MRFLPILGVLTLLTGCSITGLQGGSSFACKAPDGVTCSSVSGTHANARAGNLPALQPHAADSAHTAQAPAIQARTSTLPILLPGAAIRSQPEVIRVWIAPFEDADGDLNDQAFIYMVSSSGAWQVQHSKEKTVQQTITALAKQKAGTKP